MKIEKPQILFARDQRVGRIEHVLFGKGQYKSLGCGITEIRISNPVQFMPSPMTSRNGALHIEDPAMLSSCQDGPSPQRYFATLRRLSQPFIEPKDIQPAT